VIVVFGGEGQLGRELTRRAAAGSVALQALTRTEADITDAAAVAAAVSRWKPELVVNAAGYTKVDLAETNIEEVRKANEAGPAVIAGVCATANIPMVHISTDYVFDGAKASPYLETDPVNPISIYGRTKTAGENAVRRALKHHVILRTAWLYSEFGHNFLKTVLHLAATRDELRIVADQHGSPTSAQQLADAILHIAPRVVRDRNLSGTYHLTADGFTTWHGFASRVVGAAAPLTGRHPMVTAIKTIEYSTAAKRPGNSRLDCRLFTQTFGYSPNHWTKAVDATTRMLAAASQQAASHVA